MKPLTHPISSIRALEALSQAVAIPSQAMRKVWEMALMEEAELMVVLHEYV